jgi:hypothetical protein
VSGIVALGCRALVATVFTIAVATKLRGGPALMGYLAAAARLGGLRGHQAKPLALLTVGLEGLTVVLLVLPGTPPLGFVVLLRAALRRGERIACACFGASVTPIGPVHLVRNGVLIVICLTGLLASAGGPPPPTWPGATAPLLAGMIGAAAVIRLDRLAAGPAIDHSE